MGCYWYHKGKTFQANHNDSQGVMAFVKVVIDTTKVRLFKQITTPTGSLSFEQRCYWYHKGKTFQAKHNDSSLAYHAILVVIDTTKVRLFKQITTKQVLTISSGELLLIPQR